MSAHETLLAELRRDGLVVGEVTLASGERAGYYVDVRRVLLSQPGFQACGELVAAKALEWNVEAVGGLSLGADPIACATIAVPAGSELKAFFVRKDRKSHGLQRWIEGPPLVPGARCMVVEDVVTSGASTISAIKRLREEGLQVAGVMSVVDRLAGGAEKIRAAARFESLFTIDDIYPERPDRGVRAG